LGTATDTAINAYEQQRQRWQWVMIVTAILFNPVLPVGLSREEWKPIDLGVGVVFVAALVAFRRGKPAGRTTTV